eukprot:364584-Chlamydomonas_euryale.AAC.2
MRPKVGEMQGDSVQVEEMKHWLSKVGSPKSSIERAVFTEERPIEACTFQDFEEQVSARQRWLSWPAVVPSAGMSVVGTAGHQRRHYIQRNAMQAAAASRYNNSRQ